MSGLAGKQILCLAMLCMTALQAQAVMSIRPLDTGGHQHHRGAAKKFILNGHENSQLQLYTPDLKSNTIDTDQGRFSVPPTGKGNYHALVANGELNGVYQSAIRYVYFNGKPSGHSPAEITALNKAVLEIVPEPLPREHWHYKAGDDIAFVVRFRGSPLASIPVTLSTSHASILQAETDAQGLVSFTLPDDFPQTRAGRDNNPAAELLVHAKFSDGMQRFASWLSADYQVNPQHWQDRTLGVLVAGGGFLFGAFITRLGFRRKQKGDKK